MGELIGRDDVAEAISRRDLVLYYQPKVEVDSRKPVSMEALVRWPRDSGLVPPDLFLPLVEQSGLMPALTDFVLDEACAQVRRWQAVGRTLPVCVNISGSDLQRADFIGRVESALARHGISPDLLMLEVTETFVIDRLSEVSLMAEGLVEIGVSLAVDDFGTGHSSFSRLQMLPIKAVKVDRSFVSGPSGTDKYLAAIIRLGSDLGIQVVAEGVEDAETDRRLHQLECEVAQGFFYARPMPAGEVLGWVERAEAERLADLDSIEVRETRKVMRRAIRAAREMLGGDISWIAELKDGVKTLRLVDGAAESFGFSTGLELPADKSYCQRVILGEIPEVIPDTAAEPGVASLSITRDANIGSYVGVPVHLPDGRVYGTFCVASHGPNGALSHLDAELLSVLARKVSAELAVHQR